MHRCGNCRFFGSYTEICTSEKAIEMVFDSKKLPKISNGDLIRDSYPKAAFVRECQDTSKNCKFFRKGWFGWLP